MENNLKMLKNFEYNSNKFEGHGTFLDGNQDCQKLKLNEIIAFDS